MENAAIVFDHKKLITYLHNDGIPFFFKPEVKFPTISKTAVYTAHFAHINRSGTFVFSQSVTDFNQYLADHM